jgi:hypothetical protein
MKNKQNFLSYLVLTLVLGFVGFVGESSAQPTDAQLKKQLTGARTVSVTLGKTGTKEWSSTYKKYMWTRSFTAKLKTEEPGIFVIVKGYAAYDITGGRYVFWRTFTTSNNYEGIPDPTASDVKELIGKFGVEKFMGNYYFNRIVGHLESIELAKEPKYECHTPNSVSLNVTAVYTERTNDIGGKERVARTFRIRFYRDDTKSEWKNLITSSANVEKL